MKKNCPVCGTVFTDENCPNCGYFFPAQQLHEHSGFQNREAPSNHSQGTTPAPSGPPPQAGQAQPPSYWQYPPQAGQPYYGQYPPQGGQGQQWYNGQSPPPSTPGQQPNEQYSPPMEPPPYYPYMPYPYYPAQKSKIAAGLLGILIGSLGIHNFYLGYTSKAVVQLVLTILGLITSIIFIGLIPLFGVWIWGLVEGIMILTGSIATDANGIPLSE